MGETSGSGSCEEEVPSDHRPGEEDDSHDAYSHGVDDDPEEVHYVRGEDRDPVLEQSHDENHDQACVPDCLAYDQDHQACVPGRVEACDQDHPVSLPVRV